MSTTSAPSALSSASASAGSGSLYKTLGPKTLNQDDFLKLLVVQMRSQDPLNPKQDTEFIAQMTQFSALEQSKSMQQDIAALHADGSLLQANSMIGRFVEIQKDKNTLLPPREVSGVYVLNGEPKLMIENEFFDPDQVVSILPNYSK